jgi:hypothetical protein
MPAGWAGLGRSAQRSPPDDGRSWAAGDPPPRAGNSLDVLIEGAAYFAALELGDDQPTRIDPRPLGVRQQ